MNIGDRLRVARQRKNLTLAFVGQILGKTEATVQRYESGNIKNLKLETIEKLSKLYDVRPAYLMGWEIEEPMSSTYNFYDDSVIDVSTGDIESIFEKAVKKITIPEVFMDKWLNNSDIFFLKIKGNSMNKVFLDKSLLVVKPIKIDELKNDDIVVFNKGDNKFSVNRIFINNEKSEVIFIPDSTERSFKEYVVGLEDLGKSVKVYGKVVKYFTEPCS